MPLITQCIEPGCSKLCMGLFCIEHDLRPSVEFVRGRPWPPRIRLAQPAVTKPRLAATAAPARARVKPAA
jgi:hypothetical protein